MKLPSTAPASNRDADPQLLAEILTSLTSTPKQLHPKFLYDARGSELFDRICLLPEYYLTRTETKILRERAPRFVRSLGDDPVIIEPGSGSSLKTRILLDALPGPATYIPIDISRSHLMGAANELRRRYSRLTVLPVCADFTQNMPVPAGLEGRRRLVFFPGSTIGNFQHDEATALLGEFAQLAGPDGLLLVGADLRKDPAILEAAYNDAAGVTAAFNLNVLSRLNRDFGADFDLKSFDHRAPWVEAEGRIEMHLVSRRPQQVHIGGQTIALAAGEPIRTECCHKYDRAGFAAMAAAAGLQTIDVWTDEQALFSVQVLRAT